MERALRAFFFFGKAEKICYNRSKKMPGVPMKKFQILFFGFFLLFNSIYLIFNLLTGFDWSQALLPFIFALFCGLTLRSLLKEDQQSK